MQNTEKKLLLELKSGKSKNPKLKNLYARKCLAKRQSRVVAWTDWDNIDKFERSKPEDMTTDHIIPLNGKFVWGLHVSWNLQYLSPHDNFTKLNNCNLLKASEQYGKVLEEVGLK